MKNESKSQNSSVCPEFIAHLREEKLAQQDRRAAYVRLKFTFVIGIFSVAFALTKLKSDNDMFYVYGLLYLSPLVAVLFDFYILGGEFAVKRIRTFLSEQDIKGNSEQVWDKFLADCPKGFMKLNRLWTTNFIFVTSVIPVAIHLVKDKASAAEWGLFSIWITLIVGLSIYLVSIERSIRKAFYNNRINSDS